jgi:hypothetical protein
MDVWELNPEGRFVLAEGLRDKRRRPCPFLSYTLAFSLQLRKSTENLSHGSLSVLGISRCVDLATLLGAASTDPQIINPPRLPSGDFSPPLVGTSAFEVSELRASPYRLTLSHSSVSAVMWSAKTGIPKSS